MAGETTRYHGTCHCKKVRFRVDLDLSAGTTKCNCTWCWKTRRWGTLVPPSAFEALEGEAHLSLGERGGFCTACSVHTYAVVDTSGWDWGEGGEMLAINIACLDDLPVADLIAAPVTYLDGLHDNWWQPPAETRHL